MNALHIVCSLITVVSAAFALYFGVWRRAGFSILIVLFCVVGFVLSGEVLGILPSWTWDLIEAVLISTLAFGAFRRYRYGKSSA